MCACFRPCPSWCPKRRWSFGQTLEAWSPRVLSSRTLRPRPSSTTSPWKDPRTSAPRARRWRSVPVDRCANITYVPTDRDKVLLEYLVLQDVVEASVETEMWYEYEETRTTLQEESRFVFLGRVKGVRMNSVFGSHPSRTNHHNKPITVHS